MDKVKKFLEGYVQWLALALGAAFLGYTLYFYILEKPVKVDAVGTNTNVSPEDIDRFVWEGPGTNLDNAIKVNKGALPIPPMKPNLPEQANGEWDKIEVANMDRPWTLTGVNPPIEGDEDATHNAQKLLVKKLPDAPALVSLKVSSGHSNVPAPVVAGAPANAQGVVLAVDKNWQTVEAMVPCTALAKAFEDAKIPPELRITCMLRVLLVREEQRRDGTWSEPTTMPSLEITALQDLPDNAAVPALQDTYKAWAETNTLPICQPAFYQVLQGDVWYEPGTPNPNQANLALLDDGYDPLHPELFKGDPNLLTPKHKEEYDEYLKHKAALDAAARARQQNNRSPNSPNIPNGGNGPPGNNGSNNGGGTGGYNGGGNGGGTGGGTGGGGGRGRRLGDDPQRSNPGDSLRPPGPPGYPQSPIGQYPGGMMPPQGQPGAANTAASQALLPKGSFDPSQQADFPVWAHDDTALAGHTYRYMMKYVISSPVWHSTNLCDPQKLANQFSIESAPSAWTDPVNVESDTSFFAVEVKGKGIHFDIFKWKNGIWQMQTVQQATAGDMIGSPDTAGSKTDFTTGWTLVDVRDDPRDTDNRIIVLVSENGTVKKKELTTDQRSVMYHELYEEVGKAKAAAAGAPPGPNG